MHPRVLIVGTVPYNVKSTSRAFDAYFHNWEKENLAQIFSNTKKPCKGHCGTLYQITDHRMLKAWLKPNYEPGVIFQYEDLGDQWLDNDLEVGRGVIKKAYRFGQRHTPLTHLLRGMVWRKRLWRTKQLEEWLDSFNPECVFLAFSDDFFINQIALYVAIRYSIPIVSCIGDDYFFNKHFSLNPIYQLYKETYKALICRVLEHRGSAIYISDKIRDKYNTEFNLDGDTVYLTSSIKRKPFQPINTEKPVITYFGNIRIGRNKSLRMIADALGNINPEYCLEVYTNEENRSVLDVIRNHPNIKFGGSIPYSAVMQRMKESDISVVVEGFEPSEIEYSRFSLSTKAADVLASGAAILAFGSEECGIIEYMKSTNAAEVCTEHNALLESVKRLLGDVELQRHYYKQQIEITRQHHTLEASCALSEAIIQRAIEKTK